MIVNPVAIFDYSTWLKTVLIQKETSTTYSPTGRAKKNLWTRLKQRFQKKDSNRKLTYQKFATNSIIRSKEIEIGFNHQNLS